MYDNYVRRIVLRIIRIISEEHKQDTIPLRAAKTNEDMRTGPGHVFWIEGRMRIIDILIINIAFLF